MRGRVAAALAVPAACAVGAFAALAGGDRTARLLDDFREPGRWSAKPATGVALALAGDAGVDGGRALRLDFDFRGRGGWAAASRPLPLELPDNWELRFRIRGEAPANDLEVKLVDPSGENVWWSVRRGYEFPREWTELRVRKRQVTFAWGPDRDVELRRIGSLELAVTAGSGGRGSVWIAELELVPLPPDRPYTGTPVATASAADPGHPPAAALDGDPGTAWRTAAAGAALEIDFGAPRELGGLTLEWERGRVPTAFGIEGSEDGARWRELRRVVHGGARRAELWLPETETRHLRIRILAAPGAVGLAGLAVLPRELGATASDFFLALARAAPRGAYPRGCSGEQPAWTVVGLDGDAEEALVSEDGAVEVGERGFSLEPFVHLDGRLWSWADVVAERSLADGDLPIPTVAWPLAGLRLETTALATGEVGDSAVLVRYRLRNAGDRLRAGRLLVAVRPFQVNPPAQFLNVAGGVAPIGALACAGSTLVVDGRARVAASPAPDACGVQAFDEGALVERLSSGEVPARAQIADDFPFAAGAMAWRFELAPGEERAVVVAAPLSAAAVPGPAPSAADFELRFARERARWRAALDRVAFELPAAAAPLAALARSSLAWVLVHRDGPALQPGSRAYARSWIRDGALTGAALLRLGQGEVARDFAEWFAGFQYPDGRIPCCVDRRGADPVPEHDSHGELLHLVREVQRFTGDAAFAARMLPRVEGAVAAIDALAAERRTDAYRAPERLAYFGLLPASISHEGYSAKPMHSYWDDAFAYRGLADAADLAAELGRSDLAARWADLRDRFRADLVASIERTRARHGIEHLPGCVELGDFDPTSSTVLLEPGGLGGALPRAAVEATFERYWREHVERRAGARAWDAYTPYELRSVGTFVRLGWRERAHELLDFFVADRMPPEWNQWPEVVARDVRVPRFVGDLPHGWVASDYVRSFLDLFAYEERGRGELVLAAGVPASWLADGGPVGVRGLRTPWGPLGYRLRREDGRLVAEIDALARWPAGGVRFAPPLPATVRRATVDGADVPVEPDGTIPLLRLPARIEIEAADAAGWRGDPR